MFPVSRNDGRQPLDGHGLPSASTPSPDGDDGIAASDSTAVDASSGKVRDDGQSQPDSAARVHAPDATPVDAALSEPSPAQRQEPDPATWDGHGESESLDSMPAEVHAEVDQPAEGAGTWSAAPKLTGPRKPLRGRRLAAPQETSKHDFSPEQRLLLLDTWTRSGLPAKDFSALVGVSVSTLQKWKRRFKEEGPQGLMDRPRGVPRGSQLPEVTKRAILMLKQNHPEWGCERISDMLLRGPALPASPSAVNRVLQEAGYVSVPQPTRSHPQPPRRFERAKPNQLWQTDLFTFVLKRQNRRLYLVAFMDDHSRFLVSFGLHASQSTALVLEALEAGIASYGPPEEILTDNGPQYVTWRGKSQFSKQLEKRGIRQIVARPKRPQTLGKVERFWGTLWRECVETAVFVDLADARRRIGLFIDYYNFQRAHRGIDGLVPADRFFEAAPEVLQTLKQRVAANAVELARHGVPQKPFYLTGQLEGKPFSVHREGERLILMREGNERQEIDLTAEEKEESAHARLEAVEPSSAESDGELPAVVCPDGSPAADPGEPACEPPPPPGQSVLDEPQQNDQEGTTSEEPMDDDSTHDDETAEGGEA